MFGLGTSKNSPKGWDRGILRNLGLGTSLLSSAPPWSDFCFFHPVPFLVFHRVVPLCLCGADNQASGEMVLPTLFPRTEEEIDKGLGFQQSFFHIPGPGLVGRGMPVLGPGRSGRSGWCSVSIPSPPLSLLLVLRLHPNPGREGCRSH